MRRSARSHSARGGGVRKKEERRGREGGGGGGGRAGPWEWPDLSPAIRVDRRSGCRASSCLRKSRPRPGRTGAGGGTARGCGLGASWRRPAGRRARPRCDSLLRDHACARGGRRRAVGWLPEGGVRAGQDAATSRLPDARAPRPHQGPPPAPPRLVLDFVRGPRVVPRALAPRAPGRPQPQARVMDPTATWTD